VSVIGDKPLILVADDEPVGRLTLVRLARRLGYGVIEADCGAGAWEALTNDQPGIAILDWMMPELSGVEICRRLRATAGAPYTYLILVSARTDKEDIAEGLDAGANDFLTKPVHAAEFEARIRVGHRMLTLERSLAHKVRDLQAAIDRVQTLEGLLPICMHCKRIRSSPGQWERIETYIQERSKASFSHGICDKCFTSHYDEA
jgi:phosphoserine phosphatase RsbU/P